MRGPEYCKINRPCFKQTFVVFFADTIAYAGYLHQYLNMTLLHCNYGSVARDTNVFGVVEHRWPLVSFCVFDELFVISDLIVESISRCHACR